MLIFAAATQGYFFAKNRIWEAAALLLVAFTLFRPGFWLDQVEPPFEQLDPTSIYEVAASHPVGSELRLVIEGPDFDNPEERLSRSLIVPLGEGDDGEARLSEQGITVFIEDGQAVLEEPFPGTMAFEKLGNFDFYGDQPTVVSEVKIEAERLPKELFYIPAILLLAVVIVLQRRRADVPAF
jgi:hypothetical protein